MKREGHQHGMVRAYQIMPDAVNPEPRFGFFNFTDSPSTAGIFTKVPTKPTNHSKFTGKCGRPKCHYCHKTPAGKAMDKTKGAVKLRSKSNDVAANCRLLTWRVVDDRPGLNFSGISATGIVEHIFSRHVDDYDDFEDDEGLISLALSGKENPDGDDGDDDDHDGDGEDVEFVEEEGWCLV